MTKSENYGFNLPSRDTDDIADINQIARNFEIIDEELYAVSTEAGEAGGTAEEARGYAARAYELVGEKAPAITCQASGDVITLSDSSDLPLRDLKVYGKTEQFTTTGKNLLPYPYYDTTKTYNGLTYTDNGNGGISVKGIATSSSNFYFLKNSITATLVDGETYTFAITGAEQKGFLSIVRETGTREWLKTPCTITWSNVYYENAPSFYVQFDNGENIDTVIFPQIELGTVATEYEQYTGGMPSPNPDYPQALESPTEVVVKVMGFDVEDQILTLPILNEAGLAGVPVSSGGNYTDSKGQQWICDEINFARGVYVQRCKEIIYSNEEITEPYMSTTGELTEGAKVLYVLAELVEIPLDEAMLSAFSALHTNKPNTTITNDSGAWMSAEYVADTKLYIDNKFAELASAIVSNS